MTITVNKFEAPGMEEHLPFIQDKLLPLIAGYAKASGLPGEQAAMVSFLALSTILQGDGVTSATLMLGVRASALEEIPGGPAEGERLEMLSTDHLRQFDSMTLACMAGKGVEFAHEALACSAPDEGTVWNAHVSMINAMLALDVLVLRMVGCAPDGGSVRPEGGGVAMSGETP